MKRIFAHLDLMTLFDTLFASIRPIWMRQKRPELFEIIDDLCGMTFSSLRVTSHHTHLH